MGSGNAAWNGEGAARNRCTDAAAAVSRLCMIAADDDRHSLQDRAAYKDVRVSSAYVSFRLLILLTFRREHIAIDVETCAIVLELRQRERQLAQKAKEMKVGPGITISRLRGEILEESVFKATQNIIDAIRGRRTRLSTLRQDAEKVEGELKKTLDDVDEDDALGWASKKIQFYLSEDTNQNEVMWNLRALEKDWEKVRRKIEERRRDVEEGEEKGSWWRFGL